jgi:hypothetical protein
MLEEINVISRDGIKFYFHVYYQRQMMSGQKEPEFPSKTLRALKFRLVIFVILSSFIPGHRIGYVTCEL